MHSPLGSPSAPPRLPFIHTLPPHHPFVNLYTYIYSDSYPTQKRGAWQTKRRRAAKKAKVGSVASRADRPVADNEKTDEDRLVDSQSGEWDDGEEGEDEDEPDEADKEYESGDEKFEAGFMAIVLLDIDARSWALVHDVAWTEDKKLQGTLFGSDDNSRKSTAFVKGIARDLNTWVFSQRCKDNTDQQEFNGTPANKARYPDHSLMPYVFDSERDIIFEGFKLEQGCLPSIAIDRLRKGLKK